MDNAGKLIAEIEAEFNAKTNRLIERHAEQIEFLRQQLSTVEGELAQSRANFDSLVTDWANGPVGHSFVERAEATESELDGQKECVRTLAKTLEMTIAERDTW